MKTGVGMHQPRRYRYGAIKQAILRSMDDRIPHSAVEICSACHLVYGIDYEIARRNLSCLRSHGVVRNVGTRRAARYVLSEQP